MANCCPKLLIYFTGGLHYLKGACWADRQGWIAAQVFIRRCVMQAAHHYNILSAASGAAEVQSGGAGSVTYSLQYRRFCI